MSSNKNGINIQEKLSPDETMKLVQLLGPNKNGINIQEKLSPDETMKLVKLLGREIPMTKYAKFINEKTGEEVDMKDVIQQQQPKPSSCYEYFLDYMNCHKHVSNVLKQAKRNHTFKLNEPDLKVSSVCNKAYQMYEKCAYQVVPDSATAELATLQTSMTHHFIQDLEYYHKTTLTPEQQMEVSVKMLFDPSLQEKLKDMQASVTYDERDMEDYKNFIREQIQARHPLAMSKTTNTITPESIRSLGKEFTLSEELKELLKKLES